MCQTHFQDAWHNTFLYTSSDLQLVEPMWEGRRSRSLVWMVVSVVCPAEGLWGEVWFLSKSEMCLLGCLFVSLELSLSSLYLWSGQQGQDPFLPEIINRSSYCQQYDFIYSSWCYMPFIWFKRPKLNTLQQGWESPEAPWYDIITILESQYNIIAMMRFFSPFSNANYFPKVKLCHHHLIRCGWPTTTACITPDSRTSQKTTTTTAKCVNCGFKT